MPFTLFCPFCSVSQPRYEVWECSSSDRRHLGYYLRHEVGLVSVSKIRWRALVNIGSFLFKILCIIGFNGYHSKKKHLLLRKWSADRVDQAGVICKQEGIFRVNCMDCLDRTNVVQAAIARVVMEQQVKYFSFQRIWNVSQIKFFLRTLRNSNRRNSHDVTLHAVGKKSHF